MKTKSIAFVCLLTLGLGIWSGCSNEDSKWDSTTPFWRGNTHTHSLWSDGDAAPEWIADWYAKNQYNFLVLSDHNILSEGDKGFPVQEGKRLTPERLIALQEQFGVDQVEVREEGDGSRSMRLKTLAELRERYEEPGKFLFLQGEEVTDGFEKANIHINAFPLDEVIKPQKGDSIGNTLQRNFDVIHEVAQARGRPIIAHLNHPNFTWSLTWEDFAAIRHERFFEVYNGHNSVRNYGDDTHDSTEVMWDKINTARLRTHQLPLLYGLATDDSHHYHNWGGNNTNPGRGWIMVRSPNLAEGGLVQSMEAGNFYASTGVSLNFRHDDDGLEIRIQPEEGVQYVTEFVGTRGVEVGVVLHSSAELQSSYNFQGDELFVRARVRSDKIHPNPFAEGDFEMAWLQPVRGPGE